MVGVAATIPYGVGLGLFGRFAGGVSTSYSIWSQADALHHGHGPLRLSATVLIWPLFPLRPQFEASPEDGNGPHFTPPRPLRIGVTHDHELRVGPFDGANSLGFLSNLSATRIVAVKGLGPFELVLSVGALVDPLRQYATAEAAAQLGLYLPFFKALKVSVEALSSLATSSVFARPRLSICSAACEPGRSSVLPDMPSLAFMSMSLTACILQ